MYNLRRNAIDFNLSCSFTKTIKEWGFLIDPVELSGQMKMLYSPPHYGGITAQTSSSHLMQDDAFGDSLPPAVNNPNGGATLQTALSCITGNENIVKTNY